ncbi:MAG TPA: 4-(cytidine 5'-diphospho)-2-C-methyl-D-erythritol kinase [Patescibacteria group bacterium]|nr:4-(cytidine 5'-diphospho)-2-C-methyl-D-erythritol kinase [Patescibacteria group bacterium]
MSTKRLTLKSYAKLNLYLAVLRSRADGYHTIETVFERVDLYDTITLTLRRDSAIKIVTDSPLVPCDRTNLAYRSAALLRDAFNVGRGVTIRIRKRIPPGAGMAGGSSNAATVLQGLAQLWGLKPGCTRLIALAKKIGADVPFFLYDSSFALGQARGDKIKPLHRLDNVRLWQVVVVPRFKVPTPRIYKKWDEIPPKARLTIPKSGVKILTSALKKNNPFLLQGLLFNSLEQITSSLYPQIEHIKNALGGLGIRLIRMSGSGPAVFGILSSRKEAVSAAAQLKRDKLWQVFVTRTV